LLRFFIFTALSDSLWVIAVLFIGSKSKTAFASVGLSGMIALGTGYLVSHSNTRRTKRRVLPSLAIFIAFAWRFTKTLFMIFEPISSEHRPQRKGLRFDYQPDGGLSLVVFIPQVTTTSLKISHIAPYKAPVLHVLKKPGFLCQHLVDECNEYT
jgi:hypothetical protein